MKRTFVLLGLCLLFTLNYGVVSAEKQIHTKPLRKGYASLYYYNNTPGNVTISWSGQPPSTSGVSGSQTVPPGSSFLASVPEGLYYCCMSGNGGTYTFSFSNRTGTGTSFCSGNVYVSGYFTFNAN